MKIINLSDTNSVVNHFLSELRDVNVQNDRMRFRRNIERIGNMMAYEMSKHFHYVARDVTTPLGHATVNISDEELVLATIFRAGLPLHQGFLEVFDKADNALVSAYRDEQTEGEVKIVVQYSASPALTGKTLIIVDPMLATGGSMELAYRALQRYGKPDKVHFAAVIASQQALDNLEKLFPEDNFTLWVATVDPKLNEHKYIVPGLGDAGDLAFGTKISIPEYGKKE
jgi:uracil phosphoribosyltransferase